MTVQYMVFIQQSCKNKEVTLYMLCKFHIGLNSGIHLWISMIRHGLPFLLLLFFFNVACSSLTYNDAGTFDFVLSYWYFTFLVIIDVT